MGGWMDGWMDQWVGGWVGGWMDGWMSGWMDGWMDFFIKANKQIFPNSCELLIFSANTKCFIFNTKS